MMRKTFKLFTSAVALCMIFVMCFSFSAPSVSAYSYGSDHITGNLTSFTGELKAGTVNKSENIYLTEEDKARANLGQLYVYATGEYWRQACATIKANITLTYYNASGTKLSSAKKSVDEYYSTGGYKNTLTINYTKVPAGTSYIKLSIYSHNSLTYDMKVKNIKVYLKDTAEPQYSVCAPVTSPAKYKLGTTIRYQVTLSEPVNVSSAGYLNFKVGSQDVNSKSVYAGQSSDKKILYYDFTLPETTATGDNLSVTLTSISGLTVKDDAQYSVTVNKTLNLNNGFYVDNKPPVVNKMTTEASTGAVYKLGEKLVFEAAFSENVWVTGTPYIKLSNGKVAAYVKKTSTDTNICAFEYVIAKGDDVQNLAITGVDFAGIYDAVGNFATVAPTYNVNGFNNFMDGRNVSIDTEGATVVFPEIEDAWAKEYKVVLTPVDNISGVKAIYAVWAKDESLPVFPDAPNVDLTTSLVTSPTETGKYKLYVKTVDNVDNESEIVSPYTYMVDNTLPEVSADYTTEEGMVNQVTATATDAHSGIESLTYRWLSEAGAEVLSGDVADGINKPAEDGVYSVVITATDKAGNSKEEKIENLAVDGVSPKTEFLPDGNSAYEKSHSATVKVTDEKAGVKEYYYLWTDSAQKPSEDDENWTLAENDSFTTPENKSGTYYLHIKATDMVGNTGISTSGGFNTDNNGPEISITPNGNKDYVGNTTCDVSVEVKDAISPNADIKVWYKVTEDKENYGELLPLESEVISVDTTKSEKYLVVKAADKAGNETIFVSEAFMPDLTAPTGKVEKAEDKYYTNTDSVNVKLSATDDYSDTLSMQIKVDDKESDWEIYETAKTLEFEKTEGEHIIAVRFKDESGNQSDYIEVKYYYDVTAPEISFEYSKNQLTNQSVTVTATAEDDQSEVTFTTETSKVFDVNGSFEFVAYDEAGNIARKTAKVENIDKTKPQIALISDFFDGKKHKEAKVKIEATDENGISNVEYAFAEVGTEPSEITKCENGAEVSIRDFDGAYYLVAYATDSAGNTEKITSQNILLDNTAPTAEISYEPSTRTARDVVATVTFNEDVTITNNGGENTYTFKDNGDFTFEFKDEAGNEATATASVNWIDRAQPTAKVILSEEGWTTNDITVTLLPQPQSIIRNVSFNGEAVEENELNTYTFTEYGTLEYEIYDIETEVVTPDSVVIKIDRTAPSIKNVIYSETSWTNNDVTVTIEGEDDLSEVTYVTEKTHTFTENGEFTFKISDSAGNITEKTASVDFIDKSTPVATVTYYVDGEVYDVNTPTNKNVIAKVTFDEGGSPVEITNNEGVAEYEFDANSSFTFMFKDEAGNIGQVQATVTKIDKIAPTGYVTYSKTSWTNQDVVATLVASDDKNSVIVVNNEGNSAYTFTENGEFVFEFKDEAGNIATAKAETAIIDKQVPTLTYTLSTTDPTPFSVFATVLADERVTFINNDGKPSRQFTSNGEYKFEAVDKAGNKGEVNVVVSNISKETTPVKVIYSEINLTNQDVFVTIEPIDGTSYIYVTNNEGQKTKRFTENGEFTFTYKNAAGIEGEASASVTNIDKIAPVVAVTYSHSEITNEDVVATFETEEDAIFPYVVTDRKYTFTKNNKIQIPVSDKAGNVTNVIAETTLIDKTEPEISVSVPCEILELGAEFDVVAGVLATDDTELSGEIMVEGEVNTSEEGSYKITYSVADTAGNIGKAEKTVTVYDPTKFNAFVNGQMAMGNQVDLKNPTLDINAINVKGDLVIKYLPGKKYVGDFKTKGFEIAPNGQLPGVGYYTIYLRDSDRNARLVYVFVQE